MHEDSVKPRETVMRLRAILETVLYVDDLDAATRFYGEKLGLEEASRKAGVFVFFRLDEQMLLLFDPAAAESARGVPAHGARGPGHACFAVPDGELEPWARHLEAQGIDIEQWQDWPKGGRSFYFRDPAGNSLELASPRIWGFSEALSTDDQAG
jgi:catechol 2,3-dioxygenase-like lactoylglutathione lyase family enzyme